MTMSNSGGGNALDSSSRSSPVGQGNYVVQPGDCMESIAFARGYFWQTLWNLPGNAALKNIRDPNVLLPGDRVTVPPIRVRKQSCASNSKYNFKLLGVPCKFCLRFLDDKQQPRSGIAYTLTIDGQVTTGTLDGAGSLTVPILPNASSGSIRLQTDPDPETYPLNFGCLDPASSPTGIRGRLNNLGFSCADTGDWNSDLKGAILRFQSVNNLPTTGQFDDPTQQALTQTHQS